MRYSIKLPAVSYLAARDDLARVWSGERTWIRDSATVVQSFTHLAVPQNLLVSPVLEG